MYCFFLNFADHHSRIHIKDLQRQPLPVLFLLLVAVSRPLLLIPYLRTDIHSSCTHNRHDVYVQGIPMSHSVHWVMGRRHWSRRDCAKNIIRSGLKNTRLVFRLLREDLFVILITCLSWSLWSLFGVSFAQPGVGIYKRANIDWSLQFFHVF